MRCLRADGPAAQCVRDELWIWSQRLVLGDLGVTELHDGVPDGAAGGPEVPDDFAGAMRGRHRVRVVCAASGPIPMVYHALHHGRTSVASLRL